MTNTLPFEHDALVRPATASLQRQMKGQIFPLILSPRDTQIDSFATLQKWIVSNRDQLMQATKQFGAVLFRGFSNIIESPVQFSDVVEALGMQPLPYVGGAAPRSQVYKDVFTSNESPASEKIPFHHEMAQVPEYPSWILFYCQIAATSGGATPILRSDVLYETILERMPDFAEKLERKGVVYTRVLPPVDDPLSPIGRGWKSTFRSEDKDEAAKKAAALGVELEWLPNGDVKSVSGVLSAIKPYTHDKSRKVFFNSMVAAYTGWRDSRNTPENAVTYGDGEKLDSECIAKVAEIMDELAVDMLWEASDIICIDNNLVMHSRKSFVPPRRLLAYVAK